MSQPSRNQGGRVPSGARLKGVIMLKRVRSNFQRLEFLKAASSAEVVSALNRTARIPKASDGIYMQTVSTMLEARDDALDVRATDAESFVADLLAHACLWRIADDVYVPLF